MGLLADYTASLPPAVLAEFTKRASANSGWWDPSPIDYGGNTYSAAYQQTGSGPSELAGYTQFQQGADTSAVGTPYSWYDPKGMYSHAGATKEVDHTGLLLTFLATAATMGMGIPAMQGGGGAGVAGVGEAGWGMDLGMGGLGGDAGWAGLSAGGIGPGDAGWGMDLGGAGGADILGGAGGAGGAAGSMSSLGSGASGTGLSSILSKLGGPAVTQLLGGILGNKTARDGQALAEDYMRQSNPFADYRQRNAERLEEMFKDPAGTVTKIPGFAAGQEAVARSMAANGYLGSGNMMAAMQQYGGDEWMKHAQFLSGLAGAQFAPGNNAVGLAGLQGQMAATENNSWANIIKGIGGLAPNIMSSMGTGGSGGGSSTAIDWSNTGGGEAWAGGTSDYAAGPWFNF